MKTISKNKIIHYLEWLEDNQKFNAIDRENAGLSSAVNRECERVARMLIDKINNGDFDDNSKAYQFKVGDRVQIKSWDEMVEEFGLDEDDEDVISCKGANFVKDMKYLCGRIATIEEIDDVCKVVKLTNWNDSPEYADWWDYSIDMLKPVEE